MKRNEQYAPFRTPLTEEQKELIRRAEKPTEVYARIAMEEANRQLALLSNTAAGQNALPDEPEICLHFPGVDPRGVYSVIDMKLKSRTQRLVQPEEAGILFTDFENVLLQALFSMPENWGLTLEELEALRDEE